MSKQKAPQQKKESSLKHDRRNTIGENSKSSRKNIARGKQTSHQRERHAVTQDLAFIRGGDLEEDVLIAAEGAAKTTQRRLKAAGFKKTPDEPLGSVLERKQARRRAYAPAAVDAFGRPIPEPPPSNVKKLRSRIMYVESKADGLSGPARIGRVFFSKSGRSVYYNGRTFHKFNGYKANFFDIETREEYWISAPHKDGRDRLYVGGSPTHVDDDVSEEYWTKIRGTPPPKKGR